MSVASNSESNRPCITFTYCTQCQWLLRTAWMAQELLSTFSTDLGAVTLVPGTGGVFRIHYDDNLIWDRMVDGGFPDAKILKQRVRDRLDPQRNLGHIDRAAGTADTAGAQASSQGDVGPGTSSEGASSKDIQ